jgi:hypothetical protein
MVGISVESADRCTVAELAAGIPHGQIGVTTVGKVRIRLNCVGTMQDLARQEITLYEGLPLILYSEEFEMDGLVQYSATENVWVALIDWDAIRHQEEAVAQPEYQLS